MKKDINFLQVRKQSEGKKGANTVVIVSVIMVIIIGLIGFVFGKMKADINAVNEHITQLEQNTKTGKFAKREQEYQQVDNKLNDFLKDTVKKQGIADKIQNIEGLSLDIFNAVYDARLEYSVEKITIKASHFDPILDFIELSCQVNGAASVESLQDIDSFIYRLKDCEYFTEVNTNEPQTNDKTKKIEFLVTMKIADLSDVLGEGE